MKTKLLIAGLLLLLIVPVSFAQKKSSPIQAVLIGSAQTDADMQEEINGGFKIGGQFLLDKDRGLWLRTIYSDWNMKPIEGIQSLQSAALIEWYVGKMWSLYGMAGAESYLSGENTGTDLLLGFGMTRRVWTSKAEGFGPLTDIPAHIDMFGEISFTDADGQATGNFIQVNVGVAFGKAMLKR